MFSLIQKYTEARSAAVAEGVRFCDGSARAVSTAAERAEATAARAHDRALLATFRY